MKVSALIAATLLVVSVSAHADDKGAMAPAAPATAPAMAPGHKMKAAKTTTTTTTTTTTAAAEHMDCTTLKGKEKTTCEANEKAAATGGTHTTH